MDADTPAKLAMIEQLADTVSLPESSIEYAEQKQAVRDGILSLPPRQRAVIIQRYYLEMSEKAMAEELNSPSGTVKWLLNDARRRLRLYLGSMRH
jgi:RNA polymerase sigma-70 factor (ECF subfamily)